MNFAVLSRVKIEEGAAAELMNEFKRTPGRTRNSNLTETRFYLSSTGPPEIFALSFWWAIPQEAELEELSRLRRAGKENANPSPEETYFKLIWEMRSIQSPPATSFIRLMTFPADYPRERALEMVAFARASRQMITGLIGSWAGYSLNETGPFQIITRSDWNSIEDLQNYLDSGLLQTIRQRYTQGKIKIEFARLCP